MKYERLILKIWDKVDRMSDPFGLADADVYDSEIKNLGSRLKFSLEAGLRRLKYKFENSQYTDTDRSLAKSLLEDFKNLKRADDFDEIVSKALDFLEEK